MKYCIYVIVVLLCFSCKREVKKDEGNNSIEKDHLGRNDLINPWKIKGNTIDVLEGLSNDEKDSLINSFFKEDSIYKWFLPKEISAFQRRTVKAKSGLNIRDSLGNKIGKLVFGQVIDILEYSKGIKQIKDNGKIVKGRTAKIVTKWSNESIKTGVNSYKYNWYVLKENIGYVFEGFLYENNTNNGEDPLYNYGYLVLGEKGEESNIDLRELVEVKKVDLKKYKSKTIQLPKITAIESPKKIDGKITLPFKNGEVLVLKDTTYNSEYNPTKSYGVFYHRSFPNNYMVTENMFFMPEIHTELNIKTGDTLNRFNGYPHISPDKNYAVLVTHDLTECYHDTYFEVHKKGLNNIYKPLFSFTPASWSYPFKKNNKGSMDDIFTINWISNNEFIIKAVDYIDDCYDPEQLSKAFYLKFKIKI